MARLAARIAELAKNPEAITARSFRRAAMELVPKDRNCRQQCLLNDLRTNIANYRQIH